VIASLRSEPSWRKRHAADIGYGLTRPPATPSARFDDYRDQHPDTKLKATGYFHKIGFNMGYVALATDRPLIEAVDAAIADIVARRELPAMAKSAGMTYVPPTNGSQCRQDTHPPSRGAMRPSCCLNPSPNKGRGECRVPVAPAAACAKCSEHTR
jgi:hypothetical protein